MEDEVKELIDETQTKWNYKTVPLADLLNQKIMNLEKHSYVLRTLNVEDEANENHAIVNYY